MTKIYVVYYNDPYSIKDEPFAMYLMKDQAEALVKLNDGRRIYYIEEWETSDKD